MHPQIYKGIRFARERVAKKLVRAINLQMPGDGRYQPKALKPYLGYDQWACWLVLVEWAWLLALAKMKVMPRHHARLLTEDLLFSIIIKVTTTRQDRIEKALKHDILALLKLMRQHLPKDLHRWLHYGATSYDIISTAYALMYKTVFFEQFVPLLKETDALWRQKILENAEVLQAGRTHLQTALPVTAGFWLACLHSRFVDCAQSAIYLAKSLEGKFTGATGTSAAQRVLFGHTYGEDAVMSILGLEAAKMSTQIVPPESSARFFFELVLLSGVLGNLGEDIRILQSSQFNELTSASSTSSTMSHKRSNPILAENMCGQHVNILAEFQKVLGSLVSDLQRDLRWSSVGRSVSAILVYSFQQISVAKRLLSSLKVDRETCRNNFDVSGELVVAELLHLALQSKGCPDAHQIVNKKIVSLAKKHGSDLAQAADIFATRSQSFRPFWESVQQWAAVINTLRQPEIYLGEAVTLALNESRNSISA